VDLDHIDIVKKAVPDLHGERFLLDGIPSL
jgi:hypothetical protein